MVMKDTITLAPRAIENQFPALAAQAAKSALVAGGSVSLLTWGISVGLHAAILLPLAFFRPAPPVALAVSNITPTARIEAIRNATRESVLLPKPRVVGPAALADTPRDLAQVSSDLPRSVKPNESLKPIARSASANSKSAPITRSRYTAPQVEFFGSRLDQRKVCFVVDASGSMLGLFSAVRSHLVSSIQGLQPDQYFSIIFFNNKVYESSPGAIVRATQAAKTAAASLAKSVEPAGPTSPLAAIERAMRARDASGDAPALIYFLTDGFDLAPGVADDLPAAVETLRKQLAPAAKINTIGFWTQPHDCDVLRKIAQQSGGQFISVTK
jgi:Mg-chelatase subunit ChlD